MPRIHWCSNWDQIIQDRFLLEKLKRNAQRIPPLPIDKFHLLQISLQDFRLPLVKEGHPMYEFEQLVQLPPLELPVRNCKSLPLVLDGSTEPDITLFHQLFAQKMEERRQAEKLARENYYDSDVEESSETLCTFASSEILKAYECACKYFGEREFLPFVHQLRKDPTKIHLTYNCITSRDLRPIMVAVGATSVCTSIKLDHNFIDDQGAIFIAEGLLENITVESLDLSYNMLTTAGLFVILQNFRGSYTLQKIMFNGNKIKDEEINVKFLLPILQSYDVLHHIELAHNELGINTCKFFQKYLKETETLKHLNLSYAHLNDKCIRPLILGVKASSSLSYLDLSGNKFGFPGYQTIAKLWTGKKKAEQLKNLYLNSTGLNFESSVVLAAAMQRAENLEVFEGMDNMNIGMRGAIVLYTLLINKLPNIQRFRVTNFKEHDSIELQRLCKEIIEKDREHLIKHLSNVHPAFYPVRSTRTSLAEWDINEIPPATLEHYFFHNPEESLRICLRKWKAKKLKKFLKKMEAKRIRKKAKRVYTINAVELFTAIRLAGGQLTPKLEMILEREFLSKLRMDEENRFSFIPFIGWADALVKEKKKRKGRKKKKR
ncbi:hypothetical protein SNEBB_008618 [Seison nebaliae]|nr:hypothetical protein SNEBB_008618 [Seison nebaliae]